MATVQRSGGTASMSGDQMDDFLAARAASVETSMGTDAGYAEMDCLKDDFDAVLKVFADVLRAPAFAAEKLDVAKVQFNSGIARRNDNVGAITSRETNRLVYGSDSALGRLEEYATIAAVTRDDLVAWHGKYYHPNNMYLGVSGDFDRAAMRTKIEAAFASWPKGPAFAEAPPSYRKDPNPGVFFVEKSDVNQANIALAHQGMITGQALQAKDGAVADYFAVQVLNEVFGGGFASRLFSNVRSKKGLAYSVGGGVGSSFNYPGVFRVSLQTKSETMAEAVDALREEIRSIRENPPNEAEMQRARESILNSFIFNYDSQEKILRQQMNYAFYGLPADFLEQYRANIEKVTGKDVARVAQKYIQPERLSLLVVGKAADFDRPMDALGQVTQLDITIPPPADTTPKVAKTASSLAAGRKAFAAAAAALGGPQPESVNALHTASNMQLSMGGQSIALSRDVLMVFPDKVRETMKTPMGEQVVVLNGGEGYMMMGSQSRPMPAEMLQDRQKNLGRDLRVLVRYANDPALEAVAAGQEDVDGVACEVVAVTFRAAESRLWIDPAGLVRKQTFQGKNPATGVPGTMEAFYSDYRLLDGRQVPHKQVVRMEGQEIFSLTLETFEVNPKVEVAQFEKPAA
jgi:predicted Zn-dependent peptidase